MLQRFKPLPVHTLLLDRANDISPPIRFAQGNAA